MTYHSHYLKSLRTFSSQQPQKTAYVFLEDGDQKERRMSYQEVDERVGALHNGLLKKGLNAEQVLLIFPPELEFILMFLGCLSAGATAIPMYPPRSSRHGGRLLGILKDSNAKTIITRGDLKPKLEQIVNAELLDVEVLAYEDLIASSAAPIQPELVQAEVAFIQYTSGSTGTPKGVMISHQNLLHNQAAIQKAFGGNQTSTIVSWLPFYHDMGLIGNILHSLFIGGTCVLFSPFHFIQKPARWLKAISTYKATHSGGPNFAYELCVAKLQAEELTDVDLSSWKVAYNGSEPVRFDTLVNFSAHFESVGFNKESFQPCYGLAEATLFVSGDKTEKHPASITVGQDELEQGNLKVVEAGKTLVSSGAVSDLLEVKIIDPSTLQPVEDAKIGEIVIAGESVSKGYWGQSNDHIIELPASNSLWTRTGDLGALSQGELYVTGRIKEMIIIRGRNFYPNDIEQVTHASNQSVAVNGVAAFAVESQSKEELVLMAEVKREAIRDLESKPMLASIAAAVLEQLDVVVHDIVLVKPGTIPRTSSGKIQRLRCAELYQNAEVEALAAHLDLSSQRKQKEAINPLFIEAAKQNPSRQTVVDYINELLDKKFETDLTVPIDGELDLSELGFDSLRAMELVNHFNRDLEINLDPTRIITAQSSNVLVDLVLSMLWLKSNEIQTQDEEILI
jgi:acyl-CoA synthetase (AMP-forming)/AMP-acid ligase II/acyl carrier protein